MQEEEFTLQVAEVVQKKLGKEYEVTKTGVIKNNDVKKFGVTVRKKNEGIAQVHYISDLYDPNEEEVLKAADDVVTTVYKAQIPEV